MTVANENITGSREELLAIVGARLDATGIAALDVWLAARDAATTERALPEWQYSWVVPDKLRCTEIESGGVRCYHFAEPDHAHEVSPNYLGGQLTQPVARRRATVWERNPDSLDNDGFLVHEAKPDRYRPERDFD